MRLRPFHFAVLALLLPAVDVAAQPAPSTSGAPAQVQDEADRLFREANDLYKQKRFADAETLYEKAFAKKPAHDIASNLGYAEMFQNKFVEAAEHLAYAVRMWPPTGKDDKRQGAIERLAKVKAEVATLVVNVNVAGAHVLVGERAVGDSPLASEVFAEPGHLVVRAKRTGYRDAEQAVEGVKGATLAVGIEMQAEPASAPSTSATASATATVVPIVSATPARSPVPAFVLGGAALVAVGFGVGLNVSAASDDASVKQTAEAIRTAKASCVAGAANFDARCASLERQARGAQTLSGVSGGLLVGAGALAVGAVLYWFLPGAAPVKISGAILPDGARVSGALAIGGRF